MPGWDTPPTAEELAAKPDPWGPPTPAELAGKPQGPESSLGGAAWRKFAHGATAGFSPEIVGVGDAVSGLLHGRGLVESYRAGRDSRFAQLDADQSQHPVLSTLADVGGGIASMRGFGGGKSLLSAMKVGGAQGALRGIGDSRAPLDSPEELTNAAVGGGLGAAGGALGFGVGKAMGPLGQYLRSKLIEKGRQVLGGGTTPLTVARKPVSEAAIMAAKDAGAFQPLGSTQGAADRIADKLDETDSVRRAIVDALEAKGIKGPDADTLGQSLAAEGSAVAQHTLDPAVPKVYESAAEQLSGPGARFSGQLGFTQAENLKRSLQENASGAYSKLFPPAVGRARMSAASMVRQSIEDAAEQQAQASGDPALQLLASQFAPYKQATGKLIEASRAAEEGAARAARRSGTSLTDSMFSAAMLPHGIGPAVLAKHAAALLRKRGPSTAAWAAGLGSDLAPKIGSLPLVPAGAAAADEQSSYLADLLRGTR